MAKKKMTKGEKKRMRTQQLIFVGVGVIIILSMVLALIAK